MWKSIYDILSSMKNEYEYVVYICKEGGKSVPVVLFRGQDLSDFVLQTSMFQPGYEITIEEEKITT